MINFSKNRWCELSKYKRQIKSLVKNFKNDLVNEIGSVLYGTISMISGLNARVSNNRYIGELKDISILSEVNYNDLVMANLSYELSQFGDYVAGCTSSAKSINSVMHHFRNLDWGMPGLKKKIMDNLNQIPIPKLG